MADRRRINGPSGRTAPPVYTSSSHIPRPYRTRQPDQLRKICETGLTTSASGSAYLELQPIHNDSSPPHSLVPHFSSLKITCTVHGPRPLPRSAPFSAQLLLSTHVKIASFATRHRRGHIREAGERDLSVHLETALRGTIIGNRWPKSGLEVIITVLEGEEDSWWADEIESRKGWGMMTVLAGCITVASAAIAEAGVDCVGLVSGGVAALVRAPLSPATRQKQESAAEGAQDGLLVVLDPCPSEHDVIVAACVVGYLASRDELTEVWMKGEIGMYSERLVDSAVNASNAARTVLADAVTESIHTKLRTRSRLEAGKAKQKQPLSDDTVMSNA